MTSNALPMIAASGVAKRFGKTQALDSLSFVAERGVVAVLGPNGAGKTTLVRALATLISLDAGELRVYGRDVAREPEVVRRFIGLAGQFAAVEPAMTGRENLEMVARLYGLDRKGAKEAAASVLQDLGLVEPADRLVRTYSGGMRRRLDLGASLVGRPRLLILDEPTTGLDPRSRLELWDAIRALVRKGTDVLLTTQYLDEADQLAAQIIIVDRGRVIADGTPSELKRGVGGSVVEVQARSERDLTPISRALSQIGGAEVRVDEATRRVTVGIAEAKEGLIDAVRSVEVAGVEIDDIALRQPTLDEVFLALTGRPIEAPLIGAAAGRSHKETT